MKNKENKKWRLAHLCAYVSLAISVTILILWCCNVGGFTVVSLDSFVGIIVALLAVVVTLAIAWQIYNSIEIKDKIKKLDDLEENYKEQNKKMRQIHYNSLHLIYGSMGDFASETNQYLLAFHYYLKSLNSSLLIEKPSNIDIILDRMEHTTNQIQNGSVWEFLDEIKECNEKIISSKNYYIIKRRYEEIYNSFILKVKQN